MCIRDRSNSTALSFNNSDLEIAGTASAQRVFIVTPGTLTSFQEITNPALPVDVAAITTTATLGHADHTINYNVYSLPVAAGTGNNYSVS